jgi:hypothetical protein
VPNGANHGGEAAPRGDPAILLASQAQPEKAPPVSSTAACLVSEGDGGCFSVGLATRDLDYRQAPWISYIPPIVLEEGVP